jgi:hydrogenase expression/formation protein HypC
MCLAIPGKVLSIRDNLATVDIAGVKRDVSIDLLDDVTEGDYVLVHVGFALQKIDEQEALETLEIFQTFLKEELEEELAKGESE